MVFLSTKPGRDYNSYGNNTSKDAKTGRCKLVLRVVSCLILLEQWVQEGRGEERAGAVSPDHIMKALNAVLRSVNFIGCSGILLNLLQRWRASLVAQMVKNLPANAGDLVSIPGSGTFDPWRRERLHTPIFLPGEFHGQRSLVGYSLWGRRVGHN